MASAAPMTSCKRVFDLLSFMGGTPRQFCQQLQTASTPVEDDAARCSDGTQKTALSHPKHMVCPLSYDLFEDPVVATDGVTYEHRDIRRYFEDKPDSGTFTGPFRIEMPSKHLVPNLNLRSELMEYRAANQLPQPTPEDPVCVPWKPRKVQRTSGGDLQVLRNGVEKLRNGYEYAGAKVHDAIDALHEQLLLQMLSPEDATEFRHLMQSWKDLRAVSYLMTSV